VPVLGVIPARLGSSRLPRKPLLPLGGEPLIVVVTRRIAELGMCDRLVVATDAREIADAVAEAGFEAVMTSPDHASGTARVAEVVAKPAFSNFNFILNVQGDEPFVAAAAVRGALACVEGGDPLGTAAGSLASHSCHWVANPSSSSSLAASPNSAFAIASSLPPTPKRLRTSWRRRVLKR